MDNSHPVSTSMDLNNNLLISEENPNSDNITWY